MAKIKNEITLPPHAEIDVQAFSRVFDKTTTTYKFLWLLAILKIVESKNEPVIKLRDISREAINLAVGPICKLNLKFGASDGIKEHINCTSKKVPVEMLVIIEKYAPRRLLTPFFDSDLTRSEDPPKNKKIKELANAAFHHKFPPPYRFVGNNDNPAIEIHPAWMNYWTTNMAIVRNWAIWHWTIFLEKRNPGISDIFNKIKRDFPNR